MGYYISGYSIRPTTKRHLLALLQDPPWSGKPGFFHSCFFEPAGWTAALDELRAIVQAGQPAVLTREQCCVVFDLHGDSSLHGIEVALEVGSGLAPFLARWMPRVFGDAGAAERMTRAGIFGLRGKAPFEFGHLTLADLTGKNWNELHLLFTDDEYAEIHESNLADLLTDSLSIVFGRALEELRRQFPEEPDASLLLVPSYIELTLDPDDASADISRDADLTG